MDIVDMFSTETCDDGVVTEVIRPAAILPERVAFTVVRALLERDVRVGGMWLSQPTLWLRYDLPWTSSGAPGESRPVGSMQIAYGTPTRFEITVYRATLTQQGVSCGWTITSLCDEALALGGLSLATCPRASMPTPPKPFRL